MLQKTIGILKLRLIDLLRGTNIRGTLRVLRKHQYISQKEMDKIRTKRLLELFQKAKTSTKYYSCYNLYEELPVLNKETIRSNLPDFISNTYKKKLYKKGTGGSTGHPLIYYTTAEAQSYLWAGIMLSWEAAGYKIGDKVGFIAGTSLLKSSWKHKVFYRLMNIKVYSAFTLNDEKIEEYLNQINHDKIDLIYGYATALNIMANYIHKTKTKRSSHLKAIVSSAEVLTETMRKNIETAFCVQVYNQYGCNEAGVSAFECEHHSMHLITSRCMYESGESNLLIATDLANEACIMMRYNTGDIVEFSDSGCSCKRNFPVIKQVVGRSNDTIVDTQQKITHASFFQILFRSDETIKQYQVIFDDEAITMNLCVDGTKESEHYQKYSNLVKQHLAFNNYNLILNREFSKALNGKHKHIIDNRVKTLVSDN